MKLKTILWAKFCLWPQFGGTNHLRSFLCLCRVWDDNTCYSFRQSVLDLLWASGLCWHYPLLQPLPGAHHHTAGRRDEGCKGAPNQEQWSAPTRHPPWLLSILPPRMEAIRVSCDADSRPVSHHYLLLCISHVHPSGGLGLLRFTLLLLCHLQYHWLWGLCQQPECGLWIPKSVQGGQLFLHANGCVLHLLALQCHLYCHQAGP